MTMTILTTLEACREKNEGRCDFFVKRFVDRNAEVVSLQREKNDERSDRVGAHSWA